MRLGEDEFEELLIQPEEIAWIGRLKPALPGGIPIRDGGGIEKGDPEGAERGGELQDLACEPREAAE